jgi:diketogulonate reductase-like aldo/keto reductase
MHTPSKGVGVIPKSRTPRRITDNSDLFGFSIEAEDMELLNGE